mgnify:CR=1 FL=1
MTRAARVKALQIRLQTDRSQVPTEEIIEMLSELLIVWQRRKP